MNAHLFTRLLGLNSASSLYDPEKATFHLFNASKVSLMSRFDPN